MADGSQIIEEIEAREVTGLERLRLPFGPHEVSKKPVPLKWMTDEAREKKGAVCFTCPECGGWHHRKADHLDYVGHAALTNRLLECDLGWNWEPVAFTEDGTPKMQNGGMWIRLTVCGVTRLGFGDADGKQGGNAIKEVIGDALRNAAMRFGAALDLWHKGDLHADHEDPDASPAPKHDNKPAPKPAADPPVDLRAKAERLKGLIDNIEHAAACTVTAFSKAHEDDWNALPDATRNYLSKRIENRAGTLMQAHDPQEPDLTEVPF